MTPTEEVGLASPKSYHLQWNNHSANLQSLLQYHLVEKKFVDVTLHCPDGHLSAHKIVLSSCSPYFESVLSVNPSKHASVILRDVPLQTLKLIVAYMYLGSVDIPVAELPALLVVANELRVKGLTRDRMDDEDADADADAEADADADAEAAARTRHASPASPPTSPVTDDSEPAATAEPQVETNRLDENAEAYEEKQRRMDEAFQFDFCGEEGNFYPADLFCSICNRGFLNKQNMKRHLQTHSGVKPHQCSFCNLSFLRLSHLQRHHRTHTGERPFSCDECGKHFSRSDKLKQHLSQHHSGLVIPKQAKQRGRPRKIPVTVPVNVTIQSNPKISLENIDSTAGIPSYQTLQQIYSLSVLQ